MLKCSYTTEKISKRFAAINKVDVDKILETKDNQEFQEEDV